MQRRKDVKRLLQIRRQKVTKKRRYEVVTLQRLKVTKIRRRKDVVKLLLIRRQKVTKK